MTVHATSRVRLIALVVTVLGGFLIALQSRVNGELSHHSSASIFPAWFTMTSGLVLLLVILALHRPSRAGLRTVRQAISSRTLPMYTLTGGIFGAIFLITQSIAVPLIGVAVFSVGIVAGQTSGSLVVDRIGISASGKRAITGQRVAAAVLAVVAVAIGISDRLGSASGALGYAILAFLAGALIAPQQAVNGRVAVVARSPFSAAFVNFIGGVVLLSVFIGLMLLTSHLSVTDPWGAPRWAYLGGVLGVTVIAAAAWAVPKLGVLVFSLASVFGQLTGALVLDLVAPTPGTTVGWHLFVGVGLTFLAILVASSGARRS